MVKQMPWNDSLSKIVPIYIGTGCSNFDCRVLKPSLPSLKPSISTHSKPHTKRHRDFSNVLFWFTPHSWLTSSQKATSVATNYIKFSSFLLAFTWYHLWKEMCGSKSYIFKNLINYFLKTVECSHWWKFYLKKILYKIFSPVWMQ